VRPDRHIFRDVENDPLPTGRCHDGQPPTPRDRPPDRRDGVRCSPPGGPYRLELVRGRVVRAPRPGVLHGRLLLRLARLLDDFVEAGGLGVVVVEAGTLLERDPDTVRGPDIAFYSHARIPESGYATTYWGPPDLAVEIASPGNRVGEIQERVKGYLDAGVRLVWVI